MSLPSWNELPKAEQGRYLEGIKLVAFADDRLREDVQAEHRRQGLPDESANLAFEWESETRKSLLTNSTITAYDSVEKAFNQLALASKGLADLTEEQTTQLLKLAKEKIRVECYKYSEGDPEADIDSRMLRVTELLTVARAPIHRTGLGTRRGMDKGRKNRWGASPEEHQREVQGIIDKILKRSPDVLWTKTGLKKQVLKETKLSEKTVRDYINKGEVVIPSSRLKTK